MTVDGYRLIYLPDGTDLAAAVAEPMWAPGTPTIIAGHPRLRAVVHTSLSKPFVLLLRWGDGTDLAELDRRVRSGTHTDEDFAGCVSASVGTQRCRACDGSTHAVLPDGGTPPSSPERWRQNPLQKQCAHCGQDTLAYLERLTP